MKKIGFNSVLLYLSMHVTLLFHTSSVYSRLCFMKEMPCHCRFQLSLSATIQNRINLSAISYLAYENISTKQPGFILKVNSNDDQKVGKISKQWSGLVKEAFTDADNFGIQFPMDLDVKIKACLLGAVFLIVSRFLLVVFS